MVEQNCQVVRYCDFGHICASIDHNFGITSKLNTFQLIQSKKLMSKAKNSPES